MSIMVCRSCGLGPSKSKTIKKPIETVSDRNKHIKGVVQNSTKKTAIPTRSPSRTFPTIGE